MTEHEREAARDARMGELIIDGYRRIINTLYPTTENTEFLVSLSTGDGDSYHSADLQIPFTGWDWRDTREKLRLAEDTPYRQELLYVKRDYLRERIPDGADVHELNLLADRIRQLSGHDLDALEGLVRMEPSGSTPLERLINMTYTVGDCHIAYGVFNDEALGRFYVDNDFLPQFTDMPEDQLELLNYEKIGRDERTSEHGVFIGQGYVVCDTWPEISTTYSGPAEAPQPDSPIVMQGALEQANIPTYLCLPNPEDKLGKTIKDIQAASGNGRGFSCVDCCVPQLREIIGTAEPEELAAVNDLAQTLADLDSRGSLPTYKALLTVTRCRDFDQACRLAQDIGAYTLRSSVVTAENYARDALNGIAGGDTISKHTNLCQYGKELLEQHNAALTDYGVLQRQDGEPIQTEVPNANGPTMTMM